MKNGDRVIAWDIDGSSVTRGRYVGRNTYEGVAYRHVVQDGLRLLLFKHCEPGLPDLEDGHPVWVRIGVTWFPRHFYCWADDGGMIVYKNGKTSHSAPANSVVSVVDWSLTDPREE